MDIIVNISLMEEESLARNLLEKKEISSKLKDMKYTKFTLKHDPLLLSTFMYLINIEYFIFENHSSLGDTCFLHTIYSNSVAIED